MLVRLGQATVSGEVITPVPQVEPIHMECPEQEESLEATLRHLSRQQTQPTSHCLRLIKLHQQARPNPPPHSLMT